MEMFFFFEKKIHNFCFTYPPLKKIDSEQPRTDLEICSKLQYNQATRQTDY
jgi:hypothetical protein